MRKQKDLKNKKYKLSKYNYKVNRCQDIIIFNSCVGIKSIVKMPLEKYTSILETIRNGIDEKNKKELEFLKKKGIIIKKDFDETLRADWKKENYLNTELLEITISLTKKCNFDCAYCYERNSDYEMSKKTKRNLIKVIKTLMSDKRILKINWFGGEPLLAYGSIVEISRELINYCKENKKLYFATITTNGYLLRRNIVRELVKLKIYTFQVTVDGTKENHNKMRPLINGKGTYDQILKNLKDISDNIKSPMVKVMYRCNLTKDSCNDYRKIVDEYLKKFGKDKRFVFLPMKTSDWGGEKIRNIDGELLGENQYLQLKENISKEFQKHGNDINNYRELIDELEINSNCQYFINDNFFIEPMGDIHKCTIELSNPIGNVNKNLEIERLKTNFEKCKICQECVFYGICNLVLCKKYNKKTTCNNFEKRIKNILKNIPPSYFNDDNDGIGIKELNYERG